MYEGNAVKGDSSGVSEDKTGRVSLTYLGVGAKASLETNFLFRCSCLKKSETSSTLLPSCPVALWTKWHQCLRLPMQSPPSTGSHYSSDIIWVLLNRLLSPVVPTNLISSCSFSYMTTKQNHLFPVYLNTMLKLL